MTPFDSYEMKKRALLEDIRLKGGSFSLRKKTSNLFRDRAPSRSRKLDVRHFDQVISIDAVRKVAVVEGMITYEALVAATLPHQCLPAVVPQLKTITVGGALVGLGIESSSFRYGLVHETILEVEVLLGDGRVVICNPHNEYSDLFYALPNSYGALGYALKITLSLISAPPFIQLTHHRFNEQSAYFQALEQYCASSSLSYVDGVIFGPDEMYITVAEPLDAVPYTSNYTYMHIYYQSIRHKTIDYLTMQDYIWRWDPDWFWCSKHFGMHSSVLRLLFGKFALRSSFYWKVSHFLSSHPRLKRLLQFFSPRSESVIQDILVPIEQSAKFYEFLRTSIGISPIWICPFRCKDPQKHYSLFNIDTKKLYLDFGFWDIVPSRHPNGHLNRLIERKTEEVHGFKSLYSDSFYTEEEFWTIYPQALITALKRKYDPTGALKTLYEKTVLRK